MYDTLYIEQPVREHPRTRAVCARYPAATRIDCERYGEVFNPAAQDFRLQKQQPSLILARKHDGHVLPTPPGYGIGGVHNYYFSHMLNCLYDCRYCFLQGMYRSAHHVLFVNYEDYVAAMDATLARHGNDPVWFFSGYDCDSLALEPLTGFSDYFLPFFQHRPRAHLELRTKSTQVRGLLQRQSLPNVVVAFSFTPQGIHQATEHRVPSIERRLEAMVALQQAGWPVGLRLDPMIYQPDFRDSYRRLLEQVFTRLDAARLHSVSLGTFRLPRTFFRTLVRLYPDEPLLADRFERRADMVGYPPAEERAMVDFVSEELLRYIPEAVLHPCPLAA